ncbi:MAG: hypothetical protein IJ193_08365 [Bacilli bacterium]|nr:hypothetical protein [Bacilli bacterium]
MSCAPSAAKYKALSELAQLVAVLRFNPELNVCFAETVCAVTRVTYKSGICATLIFLF